MTSRWAVSPQARRLVRTLSYSPRMLFERMAIIHGQFITYLTLPGYPFSDENWGEKTAQPGRETDAQTISQVSHHKCFCASVF